MTTSSVASGANQVPLAKVNHFIFSSKGTSQSSLALCGKSQADSGPKPCSPITFTKESCYDNVAPLAAANRTPVKGSAASTKHVDSKSNIENVAKLSNSNQFISRISSPKIPKKSNQPGFVKPVSVSQHTTHVTRLPTPKKSVQNTINPTGAKRVPLAPMKFSSSTQDNCGNILDSSASDSLNNAMRNLGIRNAPKPAPEVCDKDKFLRFLNNAKPHDVPLPVSSVPEGNDNAKFFMILYKTKLCVNGAECLLDIPSCNNYHNHEDKRRRPVINDSAVLYSPNRCGHGWMTGKCRFASQCKYSHNEYEQLFHPEVYKTRTCREFDENVQCLYAPCCPFDHAQKLCFTQAVDLITTNRTAMDKFCSILAHTLTDPQKRRICSALRTERPNAYSGWEEVGWDKKIQQATKSFVIDIIITSKKKLGNFKTDDLEMQQRLQKMGQSILVSSLKGAASTVRTATDELMRIMDDQCNQDKFMFQVARDIKHNVNWGAHDKTGDGSDKKKFEVTPANQKNAADNFARLVDHVLAKFSEPTVANVVVVVVDVSVS